MSPLKSEKSKTTVIAGEWLPGVRALTTEGHEGTCGGDESVRDHSCCGGYMTIYL